MATTAARINGSLVCLSCSVCVSFFWKSSQEKKQTMCSLSSKTSKKYTTWKISQLFHPTKKAEKRLSPRNTRTTYKTQNPGHMLFFPRHVGIKSIAEAIGRKEARIGLGPIPELLSCAMFAAVEFCCFGKCALANFASWLNNQSTEAYITWGCAYWIYFI